MIPNERCLFLKNSRETESFPALCPPPQRTSGKIPSIEESAGFFVVSNNCELKMFYLMRTSLFVSIYDPAPLSRVWEGHISSESGFDTSRPKVSYTFSVTNDFSRRVNVIGVDGFNGLG